MKMQDPKDRSEFYKALLGLSNQDYYLRHFARFDEQGRTSATWHWSACFFTFYWLAYRKLWYPALLYFITPFLLLLPMKLLAAMAGDMAGILITSLYLAIYIGISLFALFYANAIYYKYCRARMDVILASSPERGIQLERMAAKGGTSLLGPLLVFLFMTGSALLSTNLIPATDAVIRYKNLLEILGS